MDTNKPKFYAQYVTVLNDGGFVMSFALNRADGAQAGATDYFPVLQSRTVDLATLRFGAEQQPLQAEDEVRPAVSVVMGVDNIGPAMCYAPNGQHAVYKVSGTTLAYDIKRC